MNFNMVWVSPEQAQEWLSKNEGNRRLRPGKVAHLVLEYRAGKWKPRANMIIIDVDGNLVDGQHRLRMVEALGHPVQMLVQTNAPADLRDVVDTGTSRGGGDRMGMRGIKNGKSAVATARLLQLHKEGLTPIQFSHSMTDEYAMTHMDDIQSGLRYGYRTRHIARSAPVAPLAAVYVMAREAGLAEADSFFEKLIDGSNLNRGDPILALRNMITSGKRSTNYVKDTIEAGVRAWNLHREGRNVPRGGRMIPLTGTVPQAV